MGRIIPVGECQRVGMPVHTILKAERPVGSRRRARGTLESRMGSKNRERPASEATK